MRSLPLEKADSINAFARRPSLFTPGHDVWPLGEKFPELSWYLFMEKSAVITDQWKHNQKIKTYTLGILDNLGIALLLGLICGGTIGNHFRKLYTTINDQKQVLESVNSSIQAGIALIKGGKTFTMSNLKCWRSGLSRRWTWTRRVPKPCGWPPCFRRSASCLFPVN
ncbi:MAG: hypothetical protein K6E31_03025 [bacterium]|nr:hypothetical protein [bacterium]